MLNQALLKVYLVIGFLLFSGCAAQEKKGKECPPPQIQHNTYKVSLPSDARKDIASLMKSLYDPKTVLIRDPADSLSYQSGIIDKLVEYGKFAIPSLQKEYLRLKKEEQAIAEKLKFKTPDSEEGNSLSKKLYSLRMKRYIVLQPLYRIDHPWNTEFFSVELCAHFNPSTRTFNNDTFNRGDIAVRQRAANYLYRNATTKNLNNLIWALLDEDDEVVRTVATTLRRLTKQDFGLIDAGTEETTLNAINTWRKWYLGYLERTGQ